MIKLKLSVHLYATHDSDAKAQTQQSGQDPWARVLLTDLSHITISMATGWAAMATASSLSVLQLNALAARVTIGGSRQVSLTFFQGQPSPLPLYSSPRLFVPYIYSSLPLSLSPSLLPFEVNNTLHRYLKILLRHILHFTFPPVHTPNASRPTSLFLRLSLGFNPSRPVLPLTLTGRANWSSGTTLSHKLARRGHCKKKQKTSEAEWHT